jgi:hypothetical protein
MGLMHSATSAAFFRYVHEHTLIAIFPFSLIAIFPPSLM